MLKAKVTKPDGSPVLIFGLSEGNIERLQQRLPIHFSLGELGIKPAIDVLIYAGKDEASLRAELSEWFELPPEGRRPSLKEPTRGYCPACGLPIALKKDGSVRSHGSFRGAATVECEGTGKKPNGLAPPRG